MTALILTALALSGCSADAPPTPTDDKALAEVSIEGYADVTAKLDYDHAVARTPVSEFSRLEPEYVIRVLHAVAVRTDECLTDAGQPAAAAYRDWSPFIQEEDRSYGLWSVAYASKYGVTPAPEAGAKSVDVISMGVEQSKEFAACAETGKETLMDELMWSQDMNIDSQIRNRAIELTVASKEGKSAKADWQACMEDHGIVLDPADGRPVQQYQEQGKEAEIAAIVVEAQCAQSTNAVQTLYDIQARYEAALIDAQSAQVTSFMAKRDDVISVFEDAIAGR